MKKQLKAALSLFLALTLAACAAPVQPSSSPTGDQGVYTPGTYTGTSPNGKGGDLSVSVEFSDSAILSVSVTEHNETPALSDPAIEGIPQDIVTYQSLGIDAVSGATITSDAILEAVADAVTQAGGDPEALAQVAVNKVQSTETKELSASIVVVGGGGTGITAAMTALDEGAESVIIVEKESFIGGNAIVSGGYIENLSSEEYFAENNEGFKTYVESIIYGGPLTEAEKEVWPQLEQEYADYLASGSTKVFDSLLFHTIEFPRSQGGPAEVVSLTYSTIVLDFVNWFTEKTGAKWDTNVGIVGYTWPRWGKLSGYFSGQGYFAYMQKWMEDNNSNVQILTSTPATKIVTDASGAVTGIVAKSEDGTTYNITAEKAVLLCTGGYAANLDMVKETDGIWGDALANLSISTNAAGVTGDGIRMAQDIGASVGGMENTMLFPLTDIKTGSTEAIVGQNASLLMVNQEGKRFVDETIDRYTISGAMLNQTGGMAYAISCEANSMIVDGKTDGGTNVEVMLRNGELYKADTLEELAQAAGIPADTLKATVETYNEACRTYEDKEFGRTKFAAGSEIAEGPYYAYPCVPGAHITWGGVNVDAFGQVYHESGELISGLYAAGEVVNGHCGLNGAFADGHFVAKAIMSAGEAE